MRNGTCQGIGGVGTRVAVKGEQAAHHVLHLRLVGVTVADHRLLYLQRRIFSNFQPADNQCRDRRATGLTEQQSRLRIDVHKNDFNRRLVRLVLRDQLTQPSMNRSQSLRQGGIGIGLDAAAREVDQRIAAFFDDAKPGHPQAGIDAEDSQQLIGRVFRRTHLTFPRAK